MMRCEISVHVFSLYLLFFTNMNDCFCVHLNKQRVDYLASALKAKGWSI